VYTISLIFKDMMFSKYQPLSDKIFVTFVTVKQPEDASFLGQNFRQT